MKNIQKGFGSVSFLVAIGFLVIVVGLYLFLQRKSTTEIATTNITLTNDQIFQEASTQLSFTRGELVYFRIFGQDRVQYSMGSGTNFAYKQNSKWYISGTVHSQDVQDCSELKDVPEQYRQSCHDSTTGENRYMNDKRENINYLPASTIHYIGQ